MKVEWYNRTGKCEHCGDCCSNEPWPHTWPQWLVAEKQEHLFPHGELFFGFVPETSGVAEVDGKKYPWAWIKGHGVVKGSDNFECPFLTGSGTDRPCALVGTEYEHAFESACREGQFNSIENKHLGIPQYRKRDYAVIAWERDNPNCTFKYVEDSN